MYFIWFYLVCPRDAVKKDVGEEIIVTVIFFFLNPGLFGFVISSKYRNERRRSGIKFFKGIFYIIFFK